ncbi:MAG: hybrid sensor histidine kinase/response regulator [Campylobacterota bacterium]|nr:hybrid sensor histidine kinase/response regulator [Campylobacterota bacterium]
MDKMQDIMQVSHNLKLLYVEDNDNTRISTLSVLESFFDDIILGVDGVDGLEKFKNSDIDIVVTDINMPNMNGLEMSRHIKEIDSDMPILIFSAYNENSYMADSISIGIDGYLLKPFDMSQFLLPLSKVVKNIQIKKENLAYKNNLEAIVKSQIDELRAKDEILVEQSKMAAMGEMIDVIAHQWKQPLNAISMTSELICMVDDGTKLLNIEEVDRCKKEVHHQIEHLLETLNEFRSFFRTNHNIEKVNLNSLFNSISVLLKDELLKKSVVLDVKCSELLSINANENDIKHLFITLINNAKEEMIRGDIKEKIIDIECVKNSDKIEISVKDRGRGVPKNIIDDIFRANFTTKESDGGTGIGLYISKQIVEKYSGEISASNYDKGAIFRVVLEVADA